MFANIAQYDSKVVRLFARGAVCSEGQLLSLVRMYLTAGENEVGLSGRGNSTGAQRHGMPPFGIEVVNTSSAGGFEAWQRACGIAEQVNGLIEHALGQ